MPQHREIKQDANLMRPCLALSIVAQFLSMIAGTLAVAGEPPAAPSVAAVRTQAVDRSVRRVQAEPGGNSDAFGGECPLVQSAVGRTF